MHRIDAPGPAHISLEVQLGWEREGAGGGGAGGKGGSRDDGVAVEGCGGQSRGGETTKEEKGGESFRSDAGVSDVAAAVAGAARQLVDSVNL